MARTLIAYSDCLDFQADHAQSKLISYSNENDFAGISYSVTPKPVFNVRVEAKFFKTREPSETEGESLSDESVVVLSDSLRSQQLLQIEPVPGHMHEITHRALKHNYVLIEEEQWSKEENYERTELNEHSPFDKAEVWLTKKEEGFLTNVFGTVEI